MPSYKLYGYQLDIEFHYLYYYVRSSVLYSLCIIKYSKVWREYWNIGQVISIILSPGKTLKGHIHCAGDGNLICSQADAGM